MNTIFSSEQKKTTKKHFILSCSFPVEVMKEPYDKIKRGDGNEDKKPKPQKDKYLFIEDVDAENALDDIIVYS